MRSKKRVTYKDEIVASTSSSDAKIDTLVRKMERIMEKISLNERTPPRENQFNPQNRNRNHNFRKDPPQIRQRENDQQIRPPFQDNYVDEEEREPGELKENHVNIIGSNDKDKNFLTKEEKRMFSSKPNEKSYEDSEDYKLGFENTILEVHRQYDLRRKKNQDVPKTNQSNTGVRKTPEHIPKRTTENTSTMAKKADLNKLKTSQPSNDSSYPSTSIVALKKPCCPNHQIIISKSKM